uniref:A/G-specific adenine glycosylase n=1 Tax=Eubacterium cellulosolvens TaxID=29322 RepID=UPI00054CFB87|nr:A/G-specific adenine glycosylase [[Eubacterium] cellulosolvens]
MSGNEQKYGKFQEEPAVDLSRIVDPLCSWYDVRKRDLPWRRDREPYHIWVSEIMLQQTRVEAVKPFYERFLRELPTVNDLAVCGEERLMKLWEGLGYYSRVRNMQAAARQIMEEQGGIFPDNKEELLKLKGIGAYTAGAIASIAFGEPVAAVDGNVLRVITRLEMDARDIMKQSVRTEFDRRITRALRKKCAAGASSPSAFNQGMMDLGAGVCLPNAAPLCEECPLSSFCQAHANGVETDYPKKKGAKPRRIENRTVLLIRDGERILIRKREKKGLLAGLWEFPNPEGHLDRDEAVSYAAGLGLEPVRIRELAPARHIFSHIEWHMTGYEIRVASFGEEAEQPYVLIDTEQVRREYAIPTAFSAYYNWLAKHGANADADV